MTILPQFGCLLLSFVPLFEGLENGLARTPPMGWLSWQRFRCQIDCVLYPDDCISERLIKRTVDRIVSDGYKDAGYRYIVTDDCWFDKQRDRSTDELMADPTRFPSGVKALGDYIHSKGLLFGIYLDYGTLTCAGYPGSIDHLELDAKSLAKWGVDYVKMDGCNSPTTSMPDGYEQFGIYLNKTGRPIVYSCSYPAYVNWRDSEQTIDWERLKRNCNLWRMLFDIQDSWEDVMSIINIYKTNQSALQTLAGPGHWNDPDMLLLGNFGLSKDQQRAQMGMWCMLAAPLFISADMDQIDSYSAELLLNPRLLAINQDIGGHQATHIKEKQGVQHWMRPLTRNQAKWAIAFLYHIGGGGPIHMPTTLKDMGIQPSDQSPDNIYTLRDVFNGSIFGVVKYDEVFYVHINPTGLSMYQVEEKKLTRQLSFTNVSRRLIKV